MNTEQKAPQDRPKQPSSASRLTLDQLIENAQLILQILDTNGRCVYLNQCWYDYTGQTCDAGLGHGWLGALHPEDRITVEKSFNSSTPGQEFKRTYRLRSSNGEYRWMLDSAKPLYDGESFVGWTGNIMDIHDLKVIENSVKAGEIKCAESEYKIKQLVDSLPLGLYLTDEAGHVSLVNPQLRRILGQNGDSCLTVWSGPYKLYDSSGNELTQDNYPAKKALLEQRSVEEEVTVETPMGERRHLVCYSQPIFSIDGPCSGIITFVADITDRKMSEQQLAGLMIDLEDRVEKRTIELKRANDDLIRANYDLEQYAYIANHDLQEPLRKIRLFVDLLSRNRHDPQSLQLYLNKIDAAASKMSTLVKDVFNYSALLMNRPTFVEVDLNEIARKTIAGLESQISIKAAKVTVASLPIIPGVDSQLLLLFNNIVANSLTFTDDSPTIAINADEIDGKNIPQLGANTKIRYVRIEFKDNGVGFDEKYRDRIFDIFERLQTGGSHTGNGMGLPLCKRIVENHNGFITVKSKRGSGSTFEVYLPSLQNNIHSLNLR